MKTLLLTLVSLFSINSFACSCEDSNFSQEDTDMAVVSFMENKLDTDSNDIMGMNSSEQEGFLTIAQKAMLQLIKFGESEGAYQCEESCAKYSNETSKFKVAFMDGEDVCFVDLEVTMKSNRFNSGFSSKVEQELKPKCD